uniref:Uncharacterized protein n=1 Tax=Clytia hemisphaerica TaxID=252671 RepID=A0A7M6DQ66_9CNID
MESFYLSTLDRRMRHFNLWYLDKMTPIEASRLLKCKDAVVAKELEGPGKLLGYRALNNKLRQTPLTFRMQLLKFAEGGFRNAFKAYTTENDATKMWVIKNSRQQLGKYVGHAMK